jgi:hypothetical protein
MAPTKKAVSKSVASAGSSIKLSLNVSISQKKSSKVNIVVPIPVSKQVKAKKTIVKKSPSAKKPPSKPKAVVQKVEANDIIVKQPLSRFAAKPKAPKATVDESERARLFAASAAFGMIDRVSGNFLERAKYHCGFR